eukprot:9006566-Heterocapsa_arctica.AAC.1
MATNWKRIRRAASWAVYAAITKTRRRVKERHGYNLKLMWTCRSTVEQQQNFRRLGLLGPELPLALPST